MREHIYYTDLKLGCKEHGSGSNKLEIFPLYLLSREVVVNQLYCEVEGLVVQFKVLL